MRADKAKKIEIKMVSFRFFFSVVDEEITTHVQLITREVTNTDKKNV